MLTECKILVPVKRDSAVPSNPGEKHQDLSWSSFELALTEAFGGYTVGGGVFGARKGDSGKIVHDKFGVYYVAVEDYFKLRRILVDACHTFGQQYIYVSAAGRVELVC